MRALYYTSSAYLDVAIEVINVLKKHIDLYILIEISPGSKVSTILEVDNLPDGQTIIGISELVNEGKYKYLEPYFAGCASANFLVHTSKTGFAFSTFKVSYRLWKYIKILKPDALILEAPSLRALGLFPFLFSSKKILITLHDSVPHLGEKNWKTSLPNLLFIKSKYKRIYFFYSEFSKNQFQSYYMNDRYPKYVQRMHPYSIYKKYTRADNASNSGYILFFGRVSKYKGIETLLQAMPLVLGQFPDESLIIAGRTKEGYNLDEGLLGILKNRISFINRYIGTKELVTLIQGSKFIVCPYLEATQSGVLMTAFALNKLVIATDVGAFPEYIDQNITGILVPPGDPDKLAKAIITALTNDFYKTVEENVCAKNNTDLWTDNSTILLDAIFSKS